MVTSGLNPETIDKYRQVSIVILDQDSCRTNVHNLPHCFSITSSNFEISCSIRFSFGFKHGEI